MKYSSKLFHVFTMICFHILVNSCNGQHQNKETDKEIKTEVEDSTKKGTSKSEAYSIFEPGEINNVDVVPKDNGFLKLKYEGQLAHWVRNIFQDSRGDLWFGTNHFGVMRYNGNRLEYFSEQDGLKGGRVNSIIEDRQGNVWISTYGGLARFNHTARPGQGSFTNFTLTDDPMKNEVWGMGIDSNNTFWVSTTQGVMHFDGESFTPFPIERAAVKKPTPYLSHKRVSDIFEDKNGNLWFGTDGYGITVYDGSGFTHFTTDNGLPDNHVAGLLEDSKGNIWIGSMQGGISRYDGTSFTNFTEEGILQGQEVGGLYEDPAGNIWFAAEHHGVYRYDGTNFTLLSEDDGLMSAGIISILKDREGRFWMGGWMGLFRYDDAAKNEEERFVPVTKDGPWEK